MNPIPQAAPPEQEQDRCLRQARMSLLRELSARFPGTPETLVFGSAIQAQTDLLTLKRWAEMVAVAKTLDEVRVTIAPLPEPAGTKSLMEGWLGKEFFENQRKFPREKLREYAGQHIAWSWDGTQIVGSDLDDLKLYHKLEAEGVDTERVVFDYVPDPDVSFL